MNLSFTPVPAYPSIVEQLSRNGKNARTRILWQSAETSAGQAGKVCAKVGRSGVYNPPPAQ